MEVWLLKKWYVLVLEFYIFLTLNSTILQHSQSSHFHRKILTKFHLYTWYFSFICDILTLFWKCKFGREKKIQTNFFSSSCGSKSLPKVLRGRGLKDKTNHPDAVTSAVWKLARCFPVHVSLLQIPSGLRGRMTPGVGKLRPGDQTWLVKSFKNWRNYKTRQKVTKKKKKSCTWSIVVSVFKVISIKN